jgi:hypothetical protein
MGFLNIFELYLLFNSISKTMFGGSSNYEPVHTGKKIQGIIYFYLFIQSENNPNSVWDGVTTQTQIK